MSASDQVQRRDCLSREIAAKGVDEDRGISPPKRPSELILLASGLVDWVQFS